MSRRGVTIVRASGAAIAALLALLLAVLARASGRALPRWRRPPPAFAADETAGAPDMALPAGQSEDDISRRRFLGLLTVGLGAATAAIVSVPVVGFLVGPLVRKTPDLWRPVGVPADFPIGETVQVRFEDPSPLPWAGVTARSSAYIRRTADQDFVAFSTHCTHLGCNIRWLQQADLFMCPCHGGVFYANGDVAAGPPPIPLARFKVRVNNGQVEVETRELPITGGSLPGAEQRE